MNSEYTQSTATIDFDNQMVADYAQKNIEGVTDQKKQAIRLYYAVRDGIRYDPYTIDLSVQGLRASTTLKAGRGWCVAKAILLAACCRGAGIPARLGFADVRNHLTTKRMRDAMKTDVFFWHGYTSIYLGQKWVKATPAFNLELCERFKLRPLEFDGKNDSIYHPFDLAGNKHMEYLNFRGEQPDVPIDAIRETFEKEYSAATSQTDADFDRDVEKETRDQK